MRRFVLAGVCACVITVLFAGTALAGSSEQGYGGAGGAVQTDVEGGGTLPFTGLDLGLLIGGGLLLLAVGFGLRRASRARA
jgi:hypothetical protein